jgi:DNA-binding CsgD family transcriptional regulator
MGNHTEKNIVFGAENLWILIASAFYWAWFDMVTFRPTLLLPFDGATSYFSLFFIVSMATGAIVFLIAAIFKDRVAKHIRIKPFGLVFCATAVTGNLLTMLGGYLLIPPIIMVGAVLVGSSCSFFFLEWARMYSRHGSKSASLLIAAAIALGVLLDLLIIGLNPLAGAFFSSSLNLIATGILVYIYTLTHDRDAVAIVLPLKTDAQGTLTLERIFTGGRHRIFGLSISLVAAFAIFGFSFGYMNYTTAFSESHLYPFPSDILILSRGVTAAALFLATMFFRKKLYTVYRIGILIGIVGFIGVPFINTFTNSSFIAGVIVAIGFTTFDVIAWVLLAELSFTTGEETTYTFGSGRFVIHAAIVIGALSGMATTAMPIIQEYRMAIAATIGYFLVIAEIMLLSENSALWMLIRFGSKEATQEDAVGMAGGAQLTDRHKSLLDSMTAYGLTEREFETLCHLLKGRSVPRIAQLLDISENTVKSHVQHIYLKLGVHGRQDLLDKFS